MSIAASSAVPAPQEAQAIRAADVDVWRPRELALGLQTTVRTLNTWHRKRIGPPRVKIGGLVYYRKSAVQAWLAKRESRQVRDKVSK